VSVGSTARSLSGELVLITGCSSGIGEATALACAEAGARLGICARRREELELVADKCRLLGAPDVVATVADVSDPSDASQFLRSCERLGPPYALVNNAGSGWTGAFSEMPLEELLRVVNTNLVGAAWLTRGVLPAMRERDGGVIVMVASVVAIMPVPYMALYSATKAGIAALAHALEGELSDTGISICTIYPASTATEFHEHAPIRTDGPQVPSAEVANQIVATLIDPKSDVVSLGWRARQLSQPLLGGRRARTLARTFRGLFPELE
jgi:short-subunit dehydrogenase